jgi:hypothetical protein
MGAWAQVSSLEDTGLKLPIAWKSGDFLRVFAAVFARPNGLAYNGSGNSPQGFGAWSRRGLGSDNEAM